MREWYLASGDKSRYSMQFYTIINGATHYDGYTDLPIEIIEQENLSFFDIYTSDELDKKRMQPMGLLKYIFKCSMGYYFYRGKTYDTLKSLLINTKVVI